MTKIKVLHLITRLDMGGSAFNTIETVARLDKEKYEVYLMSGKTYDPKGEMKLLLASKGVECRFLKDLVREINFFKDIKAFFKLIKIFKSHTFDIVHTHSSKAGILGRWAAFFAKTKYIVHTPHGHVFYGYFGKLRTSIFIFLEKIAAKITSKIITLTYKGKEEHVSFKISEKEKFVPIYSGIDLSLFNNVEGSSDTYREKFGFSDGDFVFGSVARLDLIKGNQYIIEAMADVVKENPRVKLILVGDGQEKEKLEQLVSKLGLSDNIVLAGFQENVVPLIAMMDVFILASLNEGMGRVILEAMACKKPVIASSTGGIPELVKDKESGILFPVGDVGALIDAMKVLMDDLEMRKQMGSEGYSRVKDVFSVETMVQKIDQLYQDLIKVQTC
jgi:glycosyltransferase involved in cell wall biosynthesis